MAPCLSMLCFECRLLYALMIMNGIHVCLIVSREHPESLDFEFLAGASAASDGATPQAVVDIYAKKKSWMPNSHISCWYPWTMQAIPHWKEMHCLITCVLFVNFNMHLQKERERMKTKQLWCVQAQTLLSISTWFTEKHPANCKSATPWCYYQGLRWK